MEIRSYRHVFELERRIYRIDTLRLNPGGIPVRALGYLASFLLVALAAARVPVLGAAVTTVPWFLRDLALPALAAFAATAVRVEGRSFRHGAGAVARGWAIRGETELGRRGEPCTWEPSELVFLPDGSDARLRRMTYAGPGVARIQARHSWQSHPARFPRRRMLVLLAADAGTRPGRPRAVAVDAGVRLAVCPGSRPG